MGITVSVNHPAFPEGTEFGIDHLGVVPNGGTLEVPEENEYAFVAGRKQTVEDAFANSELVKVSGSTSVENADELIGDTEPPGEEQGVSEPEEEETQPQQQEAATPQQQPEPPVQEGGEN